jgi:hypothetical protein
MRLAVLILSGWVSGMFGLAAARAQPAAPVITVEAPVHDFGMVPEGGSIRHVFKVKNTGGAPLEIKSVSATCGCTAAAPKERIIAPGRTGEIEVKFDTRNRAGMNEKTVTVVSNDPKRPTLGLIIKMNVEQQLGLDPAYTQVQGGTGEMPTAETWLSGKLAGKARPRVVKVEPAGPVTVKLIERAAGTGKQRGLRVSVDSAKIGQGTTRVVIATGLASPAELEHHVLWAVRGNIQAPTSVHLDLAQPGQTEHTFQVASRLPDFRLRAARVLDGPFQVSLIGPEIGTRSVKVVSTLSAAPAAFTQGKLVLESNDPMEPRREIRLTLSARRAPIKP